MRQLVSGSGHYDIYDCIIGYSPNSLHPETSMTTHTIPQPHSTGKNFSDLYLNSLNQLLILVN